MTTVESARVCKNFRPGQVRYRDPAPFFSIVIPTHRRSRQLSRCLRSLARLDYPADRFELIVVEDGGPPLPEQVISEVSGQVALTVVAQPNQGPATARNQGVARARGDWIVFTDDDCAPAPDYLQRLAERAAQAPDAAVGGRTVNTLTDNPYSVASQLLIDYLYSYYSGSGGGPEFLASNNLALSRSLFQELGGFDTRFRRAGAEDRELCDRLLSRGHRTLFAPEMIIYHFHSLSPRRFLRQHFTYGRGALHFHRLRAEANQAPIRLEPVSFYWNLLRAPFQEAEAKRPGLISALMLLSQVANASGFLVEALHDFGSRFFRTADPRGRAEETAPRRTAESLRPVQPTRGAEAEGDF